MIPAIKEEPTSTKSVANEVAKGEEFFKEGSYQDAIDCFLSALISDANNEVIYNNLGCAYMMMNKLERAEEILTKGFSLNNDYLQIITNLAQLHKIKKNHFEELKYRKKAVQVSPMRADLHKDLALCWLEIGDIHEVLCHFRRSLDIDPNQAFVRQALDEIEPLMNR